jgi:FkbM family methyltransferase
MFDRIRQRLMTMRAFAETGSSFKDRCALALAGYARDRPFGDDSLHARLGRSLAAEVRPRVAAAGGRRISLDLRGVTETMVFQEIFVDRIYPLDRVGFSPDLVLDGGAFCGMFTLLALARFPTARFVAFEPHPRNFGRLQANLAQNHAPIEAINAALGTIAGTSQFDGEGFGGHLSDSAHAGDITVAVHSLADTLRRLAPVRLVLKLDIEGAEREILPQVAPLLPRQTAIFLETHHEETEVAAYLAPLKALGFSEEIVRHNPGGDRLVERLLLRDADAETPATPHAC